MNTTFTTCAEKKAKQFLNLLQGYTKGIRMTAILILLLMGVNNAWAASIFNCGIEVNETWYKGTGTINSGNWLGNQTAFNNNDFGVITSLRLGGQYDTWDNKQTDECGWNENNGIWVTITTNSGTQKDNFKLSCYHSGRDGDNNIWKTTGKIGGCADGTDFGRYTYSISNYAAGVYKMKASWTSPSSQSTQATASFTIPGFTTQTASQAFDNTTVGNNSSKTISFGTHYGTALQTSNCSFLGTNASEFSVTSINESGVTVKFTPTSEGSKSATLTITDAHSKTCTISLTGTATAADTPDPTNQYCVYFVNTCNWTVVNAYAWKDSDKNAAWPGVALKKEAEQIGGYDVYKYTTDTQYANIIFNNKVNDNGPQTADLTWQDGKYYVCEAGKWVEEGDVENNLPSGYSTGVYLVGGMFNNWSASPEKEFKKATDDATIATLNIELEAETTHEFKVIDNNNWRSNDTHIKNTTNDIDFSQDKSNCKITTTIAGEYTFTWNLTYSKLSVQYPTPIQYNITYNINGGSGTMTPTNYDGTIDVTLPTPTKTGYTFEGWYTESDFSGSKVTQITKGSTGNKEFWAKWTTDQYTITWDPNDGSDNTTTSEYTYNGDQVNLPENPTRNGYTFNGWFTEQSGGTQITEIGTTNKPTRDVTYYAQWTEILSTITITTNPAEGGSVKVNNEPFESGHTVQVGVTTTCTVTTTANEGYGVIEWGVSDKNIVIISGWHTVTLKSDGSGRDGTLTARYTPLSRNIQFDKQSGEGGTDAATVTYTQNDYSVNPIIIPTRSGYTFGGYYVGTNGSGFQVINESGYWIKNAHGYTDADGNWLKSAENTTLYAKWTAKQYTITLDNQDATTAGTTSVTATYDADMPSATMPTKTGYHFDGYYTETNGGGTQYYKADGSSARTWNKTSATTLYAYFQKAEITGIAFDKGEVPEGGYVTFEPTIEPTPSGNTVICWELKKGETTIDNSYIIPVEETNNVKISIAELVANIGKGTYTIKATLRTGTGCESGTELSSFETNFATTDFILSTPIYLKPSATWQQHDARFAVYYWGNGENNNGWVDMNTIGCSDEYYAAEIPIGYSDFKFVRLDPDKTENNWNNRWCETKNLTIPADGKNLFDMTQIYLNAQQGWTNDGARFAAYFYVKDDDSKTKWMSMSHVKDNIYKCDIPDDYNFDWVIFGRMNGSTSTNNWDNKWNQTNDLELTSDYVTHGNFFTITKFENGTTEGSWSWNDIAWSKLDLPTITITNNNPTCGSISVKTIDGTEITSGMEVDWDTEVIVSIQPEAGYAVASSEINIGGTTETIQPGKTYTICGNTTINISFEEKGEWYLAGEMNNWEIKDEYKLVDGKILVELDGKVTKSFKLVQKVGDVTTWYGGGFGFKSLYPIGTLTEADGEGNHCSIETVHDGDYLFVWDENTKTLTIEYPNVIFLHGDFNCWKDKASHALHDRDAKVYLQGSTNYAFKVVEKGIYYTTSADSKALSTQITMDDPTEYADNCTYYASITGLYTFHFDKETRILTVTPPIDNTLAVGDYRLQYTNDSKNYYTDHVKKRTSGDGVDTVSLFILNAGTEPRVILQRCTNASGDGTWETVNTYNLSSMTLDDEMRDEHGGVWNFIISQTNNGANATVSNATTPERYTGKYYIRTNAAEGGWNEYMIPENEIFFSSYARDNEGFDYYYCKYIGSGTNVKYNIANDYNSKLNPADYTHRTGDLIQSETLLADGNVRFMWNSRTNELVGRAYLDGSSTENFLRITNATNLYDADGKNSINEIKFTDLQNWIYQVDVQANTDTRIKLKAIYKGNEQFFKGDNYTVPLLTSDNTSKNYKIRLIYNFKTNHLVCAWLGGNETITTNEELTADMMIIRRDQEQAEQLSFNPNTKQLDLVGTAYAVMTFTKAFIQNETYKERQRSLYWVSFPFDVKISDVFGFGEYGEHWILQYYDGAERAKKGLFIDSGTYWKYITNTETILKKGVGYVLALDLNKVQFLHGVKDVSLYFPSTGEIGIIKGDGETTTMEVPAHQCTITHGQMNRRIYDSHWNLIGIPGFTDPGMIDVTNYNNKIPAVYLKKDANLGFHYEFDLATNTYNVKRSTVAFKTMYSYLVQYYGPMEWNISAIDNTPAQIAARRNSNSNVPEKVSLRLEIAQNEQMIDQTFVQLQQEKATAEFDMNLDLTKIINSGANIYTLAGTNRIQTAGNTLPMNNATVPVGVVISKAGEYTFRMPDGTDGILVEFIDYETNTTTNLLYDEYTVNLTKGTFENRFALFVRPNNTATSLENINGESTTNGKDVRKVLIDNILYIVRDGQIFDARGARVK